MNEENKLNFDVSPEEDIPNFMLGGNEQEEPNCEAEALYFFLKMKEIENAKPTECSINGERSVGAS